MKKTAPSPKVFETQQPLYRVLAAAFFVASTVLLYAAVTGRFAGPVDRGITWGFFGLAALLTVSLARAPWRLVTELTREGVKHTAFLAVGKRETLVGRAEVAGVTLAASMPVRVMLKLRDGRSLAVLEASTQRGPVPALVSALRPEADALADALGVKVL
ncbi:MAG: hypothetical protein JNK72_04550 [Myxococcales bacterium]|nr:hypothetical protein [Myxococcales bacterium]